MQYISLSASFSAFTLRRYSASAASTNMLKSRSAMFEALGLSESAMRKSYHKGGQMRTFFLLCSAAALLCSCGQTRVEIAVPPAERFAPVAEPAPPAGDTDAEVADFITRLVQWGRANADKLLWLGDWRAGVTN